MAPAPHTAVLLDTWMTATYTGLWNYIDYPAVVIPVDKVQESDVADDVNHANYGVKIPGYTVSVSIIRLLLSVTRLELIFISSRYRLRAIQKFSHLYSSGRI